MKNIHLIETPKPSRLHKIGNELGLTNTPNSNFLAKQQNIYITNSEEIKEGDWYFITESISKCESKYEANDLTNICKKIILTDNKDLIKDGIQPINDKFLEWFVKNPSSEEVMVYKDERLEFEQDFHFYEIMYALSEPLQETLENLYCKDCSKNLQKCTCMDDTVEMKQETAVEFLKKEYVKRGDCLPSGVFKDALEMEAKQDQNKYSKEDILINIELAMIQGLTLGEYRDLLIEQFKKK